MPHCLAPKDQGTPQQDGMPGSDHPCRWPTDWVSSITYVQKANGKLHLCLDPHDLTKAICQDHHKMPTVEEVTHEFTHSCYFKLDAHHEYWSIVLDQESSLLTTFNSPFRWYRFLQLPFSLVCSHNIFWKMDQILEECQGCIKITDDITIHGHTEVEHNTHLWNLMQIACKYSLVFNPQKTHVKAQAINFFGCLYDANGVHPDPGKVDAIHALWVPTNVTKLQEFLGLVTYLSPFIPGLSTLTAPLHELLKKDTVFNWNCTYDATFQCVKGAVISNTTLRFFDPSLPMTIQVDASTGRPWCSTPAKWPTCGFCQQGPYQNQMPVCQHRERDASCCLQSREIPNVHLW